MHDALQEIDNELLGIRVETDCGTVYEIYPEIQQWDENGIWYRQESTIKVTGSNNKEIIIKGILSKY